MNKPHLRKSGFCSEVAQRHCSLLWNGNYWHEYGYTWRDALDKMEARLAKYEGLCYDAVRTKQRC